MSDPFFRADNLGGFLRPTNLIEARQSHFSSDRLHSLEVNTSSVCSKGRKSSASKASGSA
jgi:hypothetical protein